MHGYVEAGREEGAEVVTGGEPADGKGAFYPPTVLAQVDNSMRVAQEEIFGPVVTVIPFEDEKDAIRIANDVRYGLMATVWTGDPPAATALARRIKSGTVGINMPFTAFPGIPFGGYKQSGFGRELGLETLELLPRDEERDRLDEPEAVQPVRPLSDRIEELCAAGLGRCAVGVEQDVLVTMVGQLQDGAGLDVDDAALRHLDPFRRVAEVHRQRAVDHDERLFLDVVAVAPSFRAGRVAPDVSSRVLEAEHVAEPGHVAGAAARLGLALDPLELVGEGDSERHVASLAAAAR